MIDFHTHILPGIDDGSRSVEMSLAMLNEERKQGIDKIVFTPHFYAHQNSPQKFLERRNHAWEKLREHITDDWFEFHLGAEVQYFEGMSQVEDLDRMAIEGTPYFLLEMPFHKWSDRVVREVVTLNYHSNFKIVLAHIDRYMDFTSMEMFEYLRAEGIYMQANADFFLSLKTGRKAKKMLKNGLIQFLASDCHNMDSRKPNLGKVYKKIGDSAVYLKHLD